MELSERLQRLMTERGMNVATLSRASGVPHTTLQSILEGKSRSPTIGTVYKIALGFDLSIEELMGLALPDGMFRLDAETSDMLKAYQQLSAERQQVHWKAIMRALTHQLTDA